MGSKISPQNNLWVVHIVLSDTLSSSNLSTYILMVASFLHVWTLLIPNTYLYCSVSLSFRRKAKEELDIFGLEPKEKRQRRPEYGIKIFVPDYKPKE